MSAWLSSARIGPVRLGLMVLAGMGGMAVQMQQASVMPLWADGWALALGLTLVAIGLKGTVGRWPVAASLLWVCLGVALAAWAQTDGRANLRLDADESTRSAGAPASTPSWEGGDRWVIGRVSDLPALGAAGMRWRFQVEASGDATGIDIGAAAPQALPREVLVFASVGREGVAGAAPLPDVRVGERWALKLSLRRPHGLANPGGFDTAQWLFTLGVQAQGSWRGEARWLAPAPSVWVRPDWALGRLRQAARERLMTRLADQADHAPVLVALLMGDQSGIDDASWEVLRRTGVSHLVSVSGLHVTLFAWLAQRLIGLLWRRHPRWMLRVPTPIAARWGGLGLAWAYAAFAGWALPAQRTVWMLAVATALRSRACDWPGWLVWLMAGAVVLLVDSWGLLQASFWLSFVAVGLLVLSDSPDSVDSVASGDQVTLASNEAHGKASVQIPGGAASTPGAKARWRRTIAAAARSQGVVTWGLAPLSLWFFQSLSLSGLLVNALAIPLFSFVITPLVFVGTLGELASWAWVAAAQILGATMDALRWVAAWPGSVWVQAPAGLGALAVALAGVAVSILPLPWSWRLGAALCVCPVLWPPHQAPRWGQMQVTVVDVGQGSAVIVRTREHALLFDAGPALGPLTDVGQRVITPLLHQMGVRSVDRLVLSHGDQDHVGGATSLLAAWPVGQVLSPLRPEHALHRQALARAEDGHQACHRGLQWTWSGVQFAFLHPQIGQFDERNGATRTRDQPSSNSRSCVLKIVDAQGHSLLLTGDIEAAQEAWLVEQAAVASAPDPSGLSSAQTQLQVDGLVAPHHGSASSSSAAFLDAVKPRLVWIQSGYRNRYGHPHRQVLDRYASRGIQVLNTVDCGAWQGLGAAIAQGPDALAACQRVQRVRYWQRPTPLGGPPGLFGDL